MIKTQKLAELGIAITLSGVEEALPAAIIEKIVEYCNRKINDKDLEKTIKEYKFEKEIDDFTKECDDGIEFYIQHKKEINKDARKKIIFYRKFSIKKIKIFKKELLNRIKGYPEEFFNSDLRENILDEQNYKCFLCGCDLSVTYPHLHHIDYNKKNCSKDNFVFLCPKCHGKTNYNRGFWKRYITEHKEIIQCQKN